MNQSSDGQGRAGPKCALWGTLCTDGYLCNQLATSLYETAQGRAKGSKGKGGGREENESRSKLQYLRQAIKDEVSYQQVFGTGAKEHLIAAGDPGIANTLTLTRLNSRTGQQSNTALPRGIHEFSSKGYKRLVEKLKMECTYADQNGADVQSIQELENSIMAAAEIADIQARDSTVLVEVHESFCAHVDSTLRVYSKLREFYGSRGLKVAKHRARQGGKSEVDVSIKTVVDDLVRESVKEDLQPVLVVGDGSFTTTKGGHVKCCG